MSNKVNVKKISLRCWELLEPGAENDSLSKKVDIFLLSLISLNILSVILETVDSLFLRYKLYFHIFEIFSVFIFTIEYFARVWSCINQNIQNESNAKIRIKYIFSLPAIIDAVAILPSIIALIYPTVDLRFIRALRIIRLLKFSRYSSSINSLLTVIWDQRRSFGAAYFILFIGLIISSSGMYLVEKNVQPDKFGSIPQSMWWAIATFTSVGYGDVTPVTNAGKFFGSIIMILGILTIALPSGILAAAFTDFTRRNQRKYEDKFKTMLDDDIIDEEERKELDKLSESLNLSEEDIVSIEETNKIGRKS